MHLRSPDRDEYAGGWAGGEVGLKSFVAAYERELAANAAPAPPAAKAKPGRAPQPIAKGSDVIYVGFSKDDIEARKRGEKGRVVRDDATKYPSRNELTGGFAGARVWVGAWEGGWRRGGRAREGRLRCGTSCCWLGACPHTLLAPPLPHPVDAHPSPPPSPPRR